jgi:hypothetical protein
VVGVYEIHHYPLLKGDVGRTLETSLDRLDDQVFSLHKKVLARGSSLEEDKGE